MSSSPFLNVMGLTIWVESFLNMNFLRCSY